MTFDWWDVYFVVAGYACARFSTPVSERKWVDILVSGTAFAAGMWCANWGAAYVNEAGAWAGAWVARLVN